MPPAKTPAAALPTLSFPTPHAGSAWLVTHHASSRGLWLKLGKKQAGVPSITYAQALEVAPGTVLSRLARARDALKAAMEPTGVPSARGTVGNRRAGKVTALRQG